MEEKRVYKQASGVNIDSAHSDYDTERAIGYDGEFALFKKLLNTQLFEHSKILTNLVIPSGNGVSTTEIDVILITQHGIVVFEVKNYTGTIYGSKTNKQWTQYFKTVSNNKFNNPLKQNEYHIQALKRLCPQKMFSVVFFSNIDCDAGRVLDYDINNAVTDQQTIDDVLYEISLSEKTISVDEINLIFENLKKYTHIANLSSEAATCDYSAIKTFNDLLNQSREYIDSKVKEKEDACKKSFASKATKIISIAASVTILVILLCFSITNSANTNAKNATEAYNAMNEKFSVVSEEDIALSNSFLSVTDVTITPHDYLDGSSLSFTINNKSKTAYILAKQNKASIFVTLKDGSVQEYSLKNIYSIYPQKNQIYTVSLSCDESDIAYIKMSTLYIMQDGKTTHPFSINIYD